MRHILSAALMTGLLAAGTAQAGACDYKPSRLAASAKDKAAPVVGGVGTVAKTGAKTIGHYALMHPEKSISLVSSVAGSGAASSAAAGASGLGATAIAVITAPVTLIVGAITFGAAGSYEGLCYFKVDRVTEPDAVRSIVEDIASNDPLVWTRNTNSGPVMVLGSPEGETVYPIKNLYVADGVMKVRGWGINDSLGPVAYVALEEDAATPKAIDTEPEAVVTPEAASE
ncbi:hypothetical protein GGQ68_003042 [Sagittula marina]|uniref:Uncharacterized protein n=1 Tax=Sagittula marina TaxID=943940 RepID=A0A7W6DWS5_9RHOB|nr:hypothetical protein [Sagittula marina]MBB3986699.1 hypothetical protein [Sagittula marina]